MGASVHVLEFQARMTGVDAVQAGMRTLRTQAKAASTETQQLADGYSRGLAGIAPGAQRAAGALSMVAASGEAGQRQMRSFIVAGADIAMTFGVGGPIIAALGLVGLAIYNTFERARKEIIATKNKAIESAEAIAKSGDLGSSGKAQQNLYSGEPYAIRKADEKGPAWLARSQGMLGVNARIDQLSGQLPRNLVDIAAKDGHIGGLLGHGEQAKATELRELFKEARRLNEEYERQSKITGELAVKEGQRTKAGLAEAQETKGASELDRRVSMILEESKAHGLNNAKLAEAIALRKALNAELGKQRGVPHPDVARIDQLKKAVAEIGELPGIAPKNTMIGDVVRQPLKPFGAASLMDALFPTNAPVDVVGHGPQVAQITQQFMGPMMIARDQIITSFAKEVQEPLNHAIRDGLAGTFSSSISDGITAGFESHSIAGAFKGAGKAILAGIGGIFEQMGSVWISYGIAMTALGQALWNPFTSGPAALAIGASLVALGATLGAVAHGGVGGSAGSASAITSAPALVSTTYLDATGSPATRGAAVTPLQLRTNNIYVIGTDPAAWRQVQDQLDAHARRG